MEALDAFIAGYEAGHGVITEEEIESASRRARERAIAVASINVRIAEPVASERFGQDATD